MSWTTDLFMGLCTGQGKLPGLFFFFLILWPHPRHMEVPRPGIKSEPQLQPLKQPLQCRTL